LHPSFKDEYFKLAEWEPEWIAEAIRLARDMWLLFYKPKSPTAQSTAPTMASESKVSLTIQSRISLYIGLIDLNFSQPKTSMLAGLGNAAAARGGNSLMEAFDSWSAGGLVLEGNQPVNPLKWWLQQKSSGNTHGGLLYMALDVSGCPGEPTNNKSKKFTFDEIFC
jgi:hypothetical protein